MYVENLVNYEKQKQIQIKRAVNLSINVVCFGTFTNFTCEFCTAYF